MADQRFVAFTSFVCGFLCGGIAIGGYHWVAMVELELPNEVSGKNFIGRTILFDRKVQKVESTKNNHMTTKQQSTKDGIGAAANQSDSKVQKRPRLLCWVLTGPAKHATAAHAVKQTWGKRCDKLLFISSVEDKDLDSIAIPVNEGRQWLWAKTKGALQYIWRHHGHEADWFLKADDDTFVLIDDLKEYLSQYKPDDAIYIGKINGGDDVIKDWYMYGGTGYILSRKTLERFVMEAVPNEKICAPTHPNMTARQKGDEDVELGRCLRNIGWVNGIIPVDEKQRLRMLDLEDVADHGFGNGDELPESKKNGAQCCHDTALTFHRVSPFYLRVFDYLLYHVRREGTPEPATR